MQPRQSTAAWLWDVTLGRLFAGSRQPEAEWVAADNAGQLRFIARHGVLFEDNKGERNCCPAEVNIILPGGGHPVMQPFSCTSAMPHSALCCTSSAELPGNHV